MHDWTNQRCTSQQKLNVLTRIFELHTADSPDKISLSQCGTQHTLNRIKCSCVHNYENII